MSEIVTVIHNFDHLISHIWASILLTCCQGGLDFREVCLDFRHVGSNFQHIDLDFQEVSKIFFGICDIKCPKLGRFGFDLSIPHYDNQTQAIKWSQRKKFKQGGLNFQQVRKNLQLRPGVHLSSLHCSWH